MGLSYGWQKLHDAIHTLSGTRPQSERLISAIASSLTSLRSEHDLPKDMLAEFNSFMKDATSVNANGNEGTIAATVNSRSETEQQVMVGNIISMHNTVCKAYGKSVND